eukprot:753385-Ditylum_brightwellii.AAC.1
MSHVIACNVEPKDRDSRKLLRNQLARQLVSYLAQSELVSVGAICSGFWLLLALASGIAGTLV